MRWIFLLPLFAAVLFFSATTGEPTNLYAKETGDNLQEVYVRALKDAKKSILVMIYALSDPRVIETLRAKADEGIDVRVIYDAKASASAPRRLGSKVRVQKRSAPGLMHQKIVVIDGEKVWIGSANLTTESLRLHGNLVMELNRRDLAEAILARADSLPESGAAPLPPQYPDLFFLPKNKEALEKLVQILSSAKKTVRVAMFTWTHPGLTQAVIDAKNRGVDVVVAIDRNAGRGSSAEVVQKLKIAGVPLYLSRGEALLHHKFLYVDSKILVNGSANWTRSAFKVNDECFMILESLTEAQTKFLDRLFSNIIREGALQ